MKKLLNWFITLLILAALGAGGYWGYKRWFAKTTQTVFRSEEATRTDLVSTISATGTVEPEELVNVGAQVSGKISVFGTDSNGKTIDYGSPVKQGMVLARIDDSVYAAEMRAADANRIQADANILQAKANIDLAKAQLRLSESNWNRAQELRTKDAMSKSDYDNYKAEYDSAVATVAVREANLAQADAELASAKAAYDKAKQNIDYCIISSPVDGVIIDRRVSVGQTVVSSMAVGARSRDILQQFLIESMVLCLVGGIVGILLGHGAALLVEHYLQWPIASSPEAVVAAVAVSAAVGLVFGFYPAWKASKLDPIEALRYE